MKLYIMALEQEEMAEKVERRVFWLKTGIGRLLLGKGGMNDLRGDEMFNV